MVKFLSHLSQSFLFLSKCGAGDECVSTNDPRICLVKFQVWDVLFAWISFLKGLSLVGNVSLGNLYRKSLRNFVKKFF